MRVLERIPTSGKGSTGAKAPCSDEEGSNAALKGRSSTELHAAGWIEAVELCSTGQPRRLSLHVTMRVKTNDECYMH
jgi:hypothetical protein